VTAVQSKKAQRKSNLHPEPWPWAPMGYRRAEQGCGSKNLRSSPCFPNSGCSLHLPITG